MEVMSLAGRRLSTLGESLAGFPLLSDALMACVYMAVSLFRCCAEGLGLRPLAGRFSSGAGMRLKFLMAEDTAPLPGGVRFESWGEVFSGAGAVTGAVAAVGAGEGVLLAVNLGGVTLLLLGRGDCGLGERGGLTPAAAGEGVLGLTGAGA